MGEHFGGCFRGRPRFGAADTAGVVAGGVSSASKCDRERLFDLLLVLCVE